MSVWPGADAGASSAGSSDDAAAERVSFWGKVKAAFAIFFPPSEEETARLEAKKRLRMILVADRCAMSGAALSAMKARVVEVVGEFLDVDEDAEVDVATTQDPTGESITTMYAVSIPVRGVKPQFDVENETYGWDEEPRTRLTTTTPGRRRRSGERRRRRRRRNDVSRGVS